jgi:multiple sugar transport system substrate-binding protein
MSENKSEDNKISRRKYLQIAGGTVAGLVVGGALGYVANPGVTAPPTTVTSTLTSTVTQTLAGTVTAPPTTTLMDTGQVAVEAAKKFAGTHLGYVVESGFDEGCCKALAAEWNNQTGMNVEIIPQPTFGVREKVITEGMAKSGAVDLVNAFPIWYPDFIAGKYIVPVNQYVDKYQPDMSDFIFQDYFTASIWQPGVQWSMPIDGDIFMLYYRKDIFGHPDERANFKAQYGYDLAPPDTWQQYTQIAKFLTRKPGEKLMGQPVTAQFGGQIEFRAKGGVFWWFFNRLGAYGGRYFNKTTDNIDPAINSPAAVSALKDMIECTPYGIPEAAAVAYAETIGGMEAGNGAMNIFWPMFGPHCQYAPGSTVVDKIGYALMPGVKQTDGSVLHRAIMAAGKAVCVTSDSRNPEAAYLFAQWITSPAVHLRAVMWATPTALGALNPVRRREFDPAPWTQEYSTSSDPYNVRAGNSTPWPGAVDYVMADEACLKVGLPDILVPGWAEFQETIDTELSNAITGKKTAENALNDCHDEWVTLIDKYGKDNIMKWYLPKMYEPGYLQWGG